MSSTIVKSKLRDFDVKQFRTGRTGSVSGFSQLLRMRRKRKLKNRLLSKIAKYSRRKNRGC